MDAKEYRTYPRNAVSLESLRPVERGSQADAKQDVLVNASASAPPTIANMPMDEADTPQKSEPLDMRDVKLMRRARWALFVMAFFMGDVEDGLGPFLGVYLQQHGWTPGLPGTMTTVGGVASIIATGPIGAFIDATDHKRLLVGAFALLVGISQDSTSSPRILVSSSPHKSCPPSQAPAWCPCSWPSRVTKDVDG
ncbi:major facilitator superfamily transporter [Colletotrichum incanum]|nr:major facilitator superfamily transporter [Colletotrichum incanum]